MSNSVAPVTVKSKKKRKKRNIEKIEVLVEAVNDNRKKVNKSKKQKKQLPTQKKKQLPTLEESYKFHVFRSPETEKWTNITIDPGRGIGVIRTMGFKKHKNNEINNEQLLDLIFCVIKHHPNHKKCVVKLIEQKHGDTELASFINQLDFTDKQLDIKFADADLYEVRENYLPLPLHAKVFIVNKVRHLKLVLLDLAEASYSSYPYVGFDAEWCPYLDKPGVSIIQLALQSMVYIIDMDALMEEKELTEFLDKLFGNEKLCILGFRFNDDLTQLRRCVPKCKSIICKPKNLICLHTLFSKLIELGRKNFGNELDGLVIASNELFVATLEANIEMGEIGTVRKRKKPKILLAKEKDLYQTEEETEQKNDIPRNQIKNMDMQMSLTSICEHVLGKELDKSEQCSSWERRPLRISQLRYASLDAYCILMVMDKFLDYCKMKHVDIKEIIAK